MREVNTKEIYKAVKQMALHADCNIDPATNEMVRAAAEKESNPTAKFALEVILENNKIAREKNMPACQDCGMAVIFLEIGQEVLLTGENVTKAVNQAVREAYEEGYFRKSVLDPITRINTKDNTPAVIHFEIVEGDKVTVHFLAKGFGSENMSKLYMLKPAQGIEGVKDAIVETVRVAGANPCPPIIVGVGIGGTMEKACLVAKKSLLREPGKHNPNPEIAAIEQEVFERIQALGIGAQGFGGDTTALCVNIDTYATHIAGLPVAVNIQCHAVRHGTMVL